VKEPVPKAVQSQKTRRALLDSARALFAEHGYAATTTEQIVQRANVTQGALQYHYGEKIGLFRAVFEELKTEGMQDIIEHIRTAEGDMWDRFAVEGCRAFIQDAKNPSMQRIFYIDGPAVLGASTIRENAPGLAFLRDTLTQLIDQGLVRPLPIIPLSKILWAAFFEAGLHIAQADAASAARAEQETLTVLLAMLSALWLGPQERPA